MDRLDTPGPPEEPHRGLPDHRHGPVGTRWLAGVGALWGFLGYTILWEGAPVAVNRPFVESHLGTLALLPVRIVIWSIRLAESIAGRTFDLSRTHWWIAPIAGLVGALLVGGAFVTIRGAIRRLREPDGVQ